ncbi:MAG: hypothetical protein A2958_02500 [Candidatus Levybacteria bacterium RIFCSPLOWO2_01_FULL_38_13]|nr:MAG: hypothetical protein A2629_02920 [Candidatus Levybacteria bacterium RIFCSPHIGHO2_01_FULL_41_15]OGH35208.1 MAG: hypothetical protein A2958_02500 [Candidatus Levybacteria bacterium RIFCSPLOWO2_01_FULL_38_13]
MDNPEKRPTSRILPDGRKLPTTKGLKRTIEERRTIKRNKLGKPRSVEYVLQRSTVWTNVRPLYLRGAINQEISEITGIDRKKVKWAIEKSERVWFRVQKDMYELPSASEKRRKADLLRKKRRENGGLGEDERKSLEFARKLVSQGMVTDDLLYWKRMVFIYKGQGRTLPNEFSDRLILEVFLAARVMVDNGDRSMIERYVEMGRSLDRDWFTSQKMVDDRHFIMRELSGSRLPRNGVIYPGNGRDGDGQRLNNAFGFLREAGVIVSSDS